ncbi:hypothetical protein MMC26_006866 [Xylographa opegraphella]|nr:hypothetical protein [Xylographa opegraphella]
MWRAARRRKRAARRQKYKAWLDKWERKSAMYYAKGLHYIRKRLPHVVVKKMSERPSRFEAYVQTRAPVNEPYELTELRYRIGIVNKIMTHCGYMPERGWEDADEEKIRIWTHLARKFSPCFAEALPLDIPEQFQDIVNNYVDDPLVPTDFFPELVDEVMNSDGELEDEVDLYLPGGDSYWGSINGSMDDVRRLRLQPFGPHTDVDLAIRETEEFDLPPGRLLNSGLTPSEPPSQ